MVEDKISHLVSLGLKLKDNNNELLNTAKRRAESKNRWFIQNFIEFAIDSIVENYLNEEKLRQWLSAYNLENYNKNETVGLILAGNIPLVGFHDILCCYVLDLPVKVKLSSKDEILTKYILTELQTLDPNWSCEIIERLKGFDKVIATGSNNTNRYFEYYFKEVPSLLRNNRNSIAVLSGHETEEELNNFAHDIFMFSGQGCRNVSKMFLPKDYDVTKLFPHFAAYEFLHMEKLFMDNYDYTRTLLLMNQTPHLANEFIMLKEDAKLQSRLATVHFSFYENETEVANFIAENEADLQCIVGMQSKNWKSYSFGKAQKPELWDYADNVDTMSFLLKA